MKNTQIKSRSNMHTVYVYDRVSKEWAYALMSGAFPVFFANENDAREAAKQIAGYDINKHIVDYAPAGVIGVIDGVQCENWNRDKYADWLADETRDVEIDGVRYRVTLQHDDLGGKPWEECDGHGPVTEWVTRDKRPGELVMNQDRASKRFYDYAEAVAIAKRDAWGIGPVAHFEFKAKHGRAPTKNEVAAIAARLDYEHLTAWCDDEWSYQMLTVERYCDCCESVNGSESYTSGEIEGVTESYLESLVNEAVGEIEAMRAANKEGN